MKKPIVIAAVSGFVLLATIIVVVIFVSGDEPPTATDIVEADPTAPHFHFARGPQPWETMGARSGVVEIRPDGPYLQLTPDNWIALSPAATGLRLSWSKTTTETRTRLTGSGTWRGRDAQVIWTFARGNPQATMEIVARDVPASELEEAWTAAWTLPAGDVRHVDDEQRLVPWVGEPLVLNGWTPLWLEWSGAQQTLSLQLGTYDQLEIAPADRGSIRLQFAFASSAARPRLVECAPDQSIDVGGRFALTLGTGTPLFPSRWSDGAEAVISTVFENPADHPDALAAEGKPLDARDAMRRVRTLAFGHSDTSDPRHGNGGVLGVGLNATFAVPDELDAEAKARLSESFESTPIELAGEDRAVRLTAGDCEAISGAVDDGADVVATGYSTYDGAFHNTLKSPDLAAQSAPTFLTLSQLDGRRTSVTDQALGKLYIDRLLRERGGLFVSIPLVASRNPLVAAGKDGLLTPERDGHWTINEELVYVLADLELRTETEAFRMAGLAETVRHWRSMRRSELWWSPDGVLLFNPGDAPIDGATVVAAGTHDPTGAFVKRRDIRDSRSSAQTWFWGELPADAPVVVGLGEEFVRPPAVEWVFEQPEE